MFQIIYDASVQTIETILHEVLRFQTYFEMATDRYYSTCVNDVYVKSD
jgi:hypothetical protein